MTVVSLGVEEEEEKEEEEEEEEEKEEPDKPDKLYCKRAIFQLGQSLPPYLSVCTFLPDAFSPLSVFSHFTWFLLTASSPSFVFVCRYSDIFSLATVPYLL